MTEYQKVRIIFKAAIIFNVLMTVVMVIAFALAWSNPEKFASKLQAHPKNFLGVD